ncbi:hypothetical protein, unlikely [Trypanosoma brucei gambiense DAL972]|uniref:Uncharacterized protein n=1 Tax=Trypanosoma brucei gambiense (strain MHOM/CI/86/DAL972) TaxID=679716 RepID=C9ZRB2_TRYB9|nr:hypothetical protein, unlikely [Trypanosoma brucei gambiense DAL972]CBH11942.1 hypothetical protein, unlikely [Trypanosoma brucei gambiense DAL972]|eukprot:XP_011774227.1 hypothetical protein, unlikely [Trypanosoma brucei gambiense DAL972]
MRARTEEGCKKKKRRKQKYAYSHELSCCYCLSSPFPPYLLYSVFFSPCFGSAAALQLPVAKHSSHTLIGVPVAETATPDPSSKRKKKRTQARKITRAFLFHPPPTR